MHSSTPGAAAWIAFRSFSSAALSRTGSGRRYSSMVAAVFFIAMLDGDSIRVLRVDEPSRPR
jgi:hypothetical protein